MIYEHEGVGPTIASSAYVAPNAVVCGDVTIGEDARILFGAVLTADGGPITIGAHTIVMEQALLRGRAGHPVQVGEDVIIGPHAHVNGSQIADVCFLATGVATFPVLEPMLNDLRARRFRYNERELEPMLDELAATAAGFCAEIDSTRGTQWDRVATRLPGEQRTARWLVRQAMHEGVHHLGDIRDVGQARSR